MNLASATAARRQRLTEVTTALAERYWQNHPVEELMDDLTSLVDELVLDAWQQHLSAHNDVALFAVGGYGRRELHPGSDIDLLVLAKRPEKLRAPIENFLRDVFDLNLEVGHSVRDVKGCLQQARADITVATALLERRVMAGDMTLVRKLDEKLKPDRVGSADEFFRAKYEEQTQRHDNYLDTDYNLEPNVKTSPGGLRDIHTALWICLRQFATTDTEQLVALGVLTDQERRWLEDGRRFLWWVRFGLHLIVGRKEDQLRFAHQRELAQRLGFVDTDAKSGVERFMHHYYRHVLALTEVNDIIIQFFRERSDKPRRDKVETINDDFVLRNKHIETQGEDVFRNNPAALLEMFVIIAHREDVEGVSAATIRLIRESLHLIDDSFRNKAEHTQLFMRLLKAPFNIVTQLTRMRRYGVLARYIPEFGQIVGQMQHDLFHIYTVDAHTMMVIGNMRRFRYPEAMQHAPVAHQCVQAIPKPELLYIAGLYHDIGKGRGGDHSELGAVDARLFCQRHQLNAADTDTVCWLVERHLYMSSVSQHQDIYDPEVVQDFAREVRSEMRLNYLYALTVADINATNPTLWNNWRASLLRHLFNETRKALKNGLASLPDRADAIKACQESALERLQDATETTPQQINTLWQDLGEDLFLRHPPAQIAQLTEHLLEHNRADGVFVHLEDTPTQSASEGATLIYLMLADRPGAFAAIVTSLSKLNLSIVDASIHTSASGQCFNTVTVLNHAGEAIAEQDSLRQRICDSLRKSLNDETLDTAGEERRISRQLRELPWPTEVEVTTEDNLTTISILAADRPGLLAHLGLLFMELKLTLRSARITTLGERVEDIFIVQNERGEGLYDTEEIYTLQHTLRQRLDSELGKTIGV
ncbi:MAG TPA: [protein-PII] uridylyltransferase [Gammaproteobacteria bacterium]|nr:[protein-PII] uridylyltransferase [Gammaproteobacteria bacterium]